MHSYKTSLNVRLRPIIVSPKMYYVVVEVVIVNVHIENRIMVIVRMIHTDDLCVYALILSIGLDYSIVKQYFIALTMLDIEESKHR